MSHQERLFDYLPGSSNLLPMDGRPQIQDQALNLMATWVSSIADQVRNPVAGLTAVTHIISREVKSLQRTGVFNTVLVEQGLSQMLGRLGSLDQYLGELSEYTRSSVLDLKEVHLHREWCNIESHIRHCVTGDFGLDVTFSGDPILKIDLDRFKWMLSALVLNSVEASARQAEIQVMIVFHEKKLADRNYFAVTVEDEGPGFSEVALLKARQPFFTSKEAGTGLGLAMIEKYARLHGGTLEFGNRFDGGAFVQILFPKDS